MIIFDLLQRKRLEQDIEAIENGALTYEEYFQQIAQERAQERYFGAKGPVIIGLLGGAVALPIAGPVAALGAGAVAMLQIAENWKKGTARIQQIEDGDVHEDLPKDWQILYEEKYGSSLPLPGSPAFIRQQKALPPAQTAEAKNEDTDSKAAEHQAENSGNGSGGDDGESTPEAAANMGEPFDLKAMVSPLKSSVITGPMGAGKGMFIAAALDLVPENFIIFAIDLKCVAEEFGYLDNDRISRVYRGEGDKMSPEQMSAFVQKIITDFNQVAGPKLLFFDEFVSAANGCQLAKDGSLQIIENFLTNMASLADVKQAYVWLGTQQVDLKAMKLSGSTLANYRKLALIPADGEAYLDNLCRLSYIPTSAKADQQEIMQNSAASPVGRALYFSPNNSWHPMPKLANPTGYDRDSRTWENEEITEHKFKTPTMIFDLTLGQFAERESIESASNTPEDMGAASAKPKPKAAPKISPAQRKQQEAQDDFDRLSSSPDAQLVIEDFGADTPAHYAFISLLRLAEKSGDSGAFYSPGQVGRAFRGKYEIKPATAAAEALDSLAEAGLIEVDVPKRGKPKYGLIEGYSVAEDWEKQSDDSAPYPNCFSEGDSQAA